MQPEPTPIGGGGSGGGGGGYGGDPTPPNPCSPITYSIRPVAIQSVNNGKRVMVAQPDVGGDDGSGGGSSPCASVAQVITNNVNNPCLHKMVDAAINRDIKYNLQKSMVGIFGGKQTTFNLNFIDGPLDLSTSGITDVLSASGNYSTSQQRYTDLNSMNILITLNSSVLPSASDEFTTATILHETLHAYFRITNTSFDHEVMVSHYIPWFKSTLQAVYPIMTDYDATALAYGGLTQTAGFGMGPEAPMLNNYLLTNGYYKTSSLGTPCK